MKKLISFVLPVIEICCVILLVVFISHNIKFISHINENGIMLYDITPWYLFILLIVVLGVLFMITIINFLKMKDLFSVDSYIIQELFISDNKLIKVFQIILMIILHGYFVLAEFNENIIIFVEDIKTIID